MDKDKEIISGFISIIGRTNVGKSTLLNALIKRKISIVTDKPQTTRNRIQGIYNDKESQIIFIDTPGIHKSRNVLGAYMNKFALKSLRGVDAIIFLVPADEPIGDNDLFIVKHLEKITDVPIILIISKMDLVNDQELNNKITQWSEYKFKNIIPISSKENINISELLLQLKNNLPKGPKYFPGDPYTDQPEKFIIKEIIREKILTLTEQEVPHSVMIVVNKVEDEKNLLKIYASIIVEKESQKPIIIGQKGNLIKQIGILSRKDLEELFHVKVFLDLFVKVEDKWRSNEKLIKKLGYGNDERY